MEDGARVVPPLLHDRPTPSSGLWAELHGPSLASGDPSAARSKVPLALRGEGSRACDICCGSFHGGPAPQCAG